MRKIYVIAALFLLPIWVMARPAGQQSMYPSGVEMTQATQASASNPPDRLLEGCVEGTRDNLTMTDATGKVYQLRGEITQLADHIGQQASITGTEAPRNDPATAEAQPTFTVKKVKMIASVCTASR
ncbi:MAG TPA: hypothetical protein VKE93_07390 [Candidatus Angelobacter sp.]|nr:hypothetical protein [Candidatus Angelobacter sp.]